MSSQTQGLDPILSFAASTRSSVGPSNITRQDLNGTIISLDTIYGQELSMAAGIAFALGVLLLVVAILFGIARAFNKCGGNLPKESGYTKKEVLVTKILFLVSAIFAFSFLSVGLKGNTLIFNALPTTVELYDNLTANPFVNAWNTLYLDATNLVGVSVSLATNWRNDLNDVYNSAISSDSTVGPLLADAAQEFSQYQALSDNLSYALDDLNQNASISFATVLATSFNATYVLDLYSNIYNALSVLSPLVPQIANLTTNPLRPIPIPSLLPSDLSQVLDRYTLQIITLQDQLNAAYKNLTITLDSAPISESDLNKYFIQNSSSRQDAIRTCLNNLYLNPVNLALQPLYTTLSNKTSLCSQAIEWARDSYDQSKQQSDGSELYKGLMNYLKPIASGGVIAVYVLFTLFGLVLLATGYCFARDHYDFQLWIAGFLVFLSFALFILCGFFFPVSIAIGDTCDARFTLLTPDPTTGYARAYASCNQDLVSPSSAALSLRASMLQSNESACFNASQGWEDLAITANNTVKAAHLILVSSGSSIPSSSDRVARFAYLLSAFPLYQSIASEIQSKSAALISLKAELSILLESFALNQTYDFPISVLSDTIQKIDPTQLTQFQPNLSTYLDYLTIADTTTSKDVLSTLRLDIARSTRIVNRTVSAMLDLTSEILEISAYAAPIQTSIEALALAQIEAGPVANLLSNATQIESEALQVYTELDTCPTRFEERNKFERELCNNVLPGFDVSWFAQSILAVFTIPIIVSTIMGYKRLGSQQTSEVDKFIKETSEKSIFGTIGKEGTKKRPSLEAVV